MKKKSVIGIIIGAVVGVVSIVVAIITGHKVKKKKIMDDPKKYKPV
ncbi:MAG: hypothetical protein ACI4F4_01600 [Lachnospiraceae bacterium]